MHLILMALIGITTTQPPLVDQAGDGSWTAPGYRVVEEVSINPLDYGEPIGWFGDQAQIACQMFFVPTDEGEKWRVVILFSEKVVVLQENEEVREIPISCSPRGAIFSRGGRYVLVQGNLENQWYDELINIDTGEVQPYLFRQETGWTGFVYVCDDGSTVRLRYGNDLAGVPGQLHFIDASLKTTGQWFDRTCCANIEFGVSADGSLKVMALAERENSSTVFTSYTTVAFDGDGNILWTSSENIGFPLVTSDGSYVVLPSKDKICCLDGQTGELLQQYDLNEYPNALTCSRTGQSWAAQLRGMWGYYEEDQRYDAIRGLAWGTDPARADDMRILSYVSDEWDHINPYRVSETGITLGIATALPGSGHNHAIWKFVYVNSRGEIVWISQMVNLNIEQSLYKMATYNYNHEHELGSIPSALQSDGNRFGFYDGKTLKYFRIEGSVQQ
jgi:hypothetical protein